MQSQQEEAMAKKGKKSRPVVMKCDDGNIIHIKLDRMKPRAPMLSGGGHHHTREDDILKGRCRKPKHKGRADDW